MIKIEVKDFNLKSSIESGQFFRYEKSDEEYIVILTDRVISVKQIDTTLYVESSNYDNLENVVKIFFDLYTDYNIFNEYIIKNDVNLKDIVDSSTGFKVLRMEPFESLISYIISANNSVNNIKRCVDNISSKYGKKVTFKSNDYYLFPSSIDLINVSIDEYRELKVGFRAPYLYEIVKKINKNEFDLNKIHEMNTEQSMGYLMMEKGIGLKVASCILLFAYQKYDVFPIDTWVKKIMLELYNTDDIKEIKKIAKEVYREYSGIVIQYLFNYKRNK